MFLLKILLGYFEPNRDFNSKFLIKDNVFINYLHNFQDLLYPSELRFINTLLCMLKKHYKTFSLYKVCSSLIHFHLYFHVNVQIVYYWFMPFNENNKTQYVFWSIETQSNTQFRWNYIKMYENEVSIVRIHVWHKNLMETENVWQKTYIKHFLNVFHATNVSHLKVL